jgi:hypothetical protein
VHREVTRSRAAPMVIQWLVDGGFEGVGSTPDEFLKFVRGESDKLGKVIRDNAVAVE